MDFWVADESCTGESAEATLMKLYRLSVLADPHSCERPYRATEMLGKGLRLTRIEPEIPAFTALGAGTGPTRGGS